MWTGPSKRYDLIFLDYLLGVETGLGVFHQIREEGCFLPVIMLTGHGSEEIAVEAMKAGVSDSRETASNFATRNPQFLLLNFSFDISFLTI